MFRLCSARARKTAKDAHRQRSVPCEVRHAVTNTSPDYGQLAGVPGIARWADPRVVETFFETTFWTVRCTWSGARDLSSNRVLPRYGIHRRKEAGRQDVLLPGGVGPCRRRATDRLPALPRLRRGGRDPPVRARAGRAGSHPAPRLR